MKITFTKQLESISGDANIALISIERGAEDSHTYINEQGRKIIVIGVKEPEKITRRKLALLAREMIMLARGQKIKRIALSFLDFHFPNTESDDVDLGQLLAENFVMANYEYTDTRTEPENGWQFIKELIMADASIGAKKGIKKGSTIAEEVNKTRTLANTPGGDMTPIILAKKAMESAKGTKIKVNILDEREMKRLKMGAVLGVAQGSMQKPRFIIMEYKGNPKSAAPIVLVGKGITFDTGGINLKPSGHILGMNMDMSGGAAVIHTVALAAKLGLKKNVVGLIPAVENMPSGSSYRPSDVLTSMSGKTIEIHNTDAEGRVVLADALTYAEKYKPSLVVDVATLTGAALVALGQHASIIITKDAALSRDTQKWGEESGDYVWPLPLWEEYEIGIKGTFGDVSNTNNNKFTGAGAITGAAFLQEFTRNYNCPWMHIDMSPRMEAIESEYLAKGAVGAPVRLLLKLLEKYK